MTTKYFCVNTNAETTCDLGGIVVNRDIGPAQGSGTVQSGQPSNTGNFVEALVFDIDVSPDGPSTGNHNISLNVSGMTSDTLGRFRVQAIDDAGCTVSDSSVYSAQFSTAGIKTFNSVSLTWAGGDERLRISLEVMDVCECNGKSITIALDADSFVEAPWTISAGQTVAVNTAIETDSALALILSLVLNKAVETDTALGISPKITLGIAAETDTARLLNPQLILGLASETDTAFVVTVDLEAPQIVNVGIASETDTVLAINPRLILNLAAEVDTAQLINPQLVLGLAVETDTGRKLDPLLIIQLAIETDTALVINPDLDIPLVVTPGIAIEADTGLAINPLVILSRAAETDTAFPILPTFSVDVGQAVESDTARVMTPVLTLGLASEADTGLQIDPLLILSKAIETDSALGINSRLILQPAIETDAALALVPVLILSRASETDTALAITAALAGTTLGGTYNASALFPTGQEDVSITLYDPLTGDTISLASNSCLEIGSTGLYIWSAKDLTTQPIGYQEYAWKMDDGVSSRGGIIRLPQHELVDYIKSQLIYD